MYTYMSINTSTIIKLKMIGAMISHPEESLHSLLSVVASFSSVGTGEPEGKVRGSHLEPPPVLLAAGHEEPLLKYKHDVRHVYTGT